MKKIKMKNCWKFYLIIYLGVILTFPLNAQRNKIFGDWRLVAKTSERFTINEYFETYPYSYEHIRNSESNNYDVFHFYKNYLLLEDYGTVQILSDFNFLNQKLILNQKYGSNRMYEIIYFSKSDLIIYDNQNEIFLYLIKLSKFKHRIKNVAKMKDKLIQDNGKDYEGYIKPNSGKLPLAIKSVYKGDSDKIQNKGKHT